MIDYLRLTAEALLITAAIEVGIAWLFRLRSKTELLTVLIINVITNPLLNYLMLVNGYFHLISEYRVLMVVLEAGVVLAEWQLLLWVLRKGGKKMLVLSVAMNGLSCIVGLVIFW